MSSLYERLTPREFKERLAKCPVAYLPLGTIEWHGPQNPLGADGLQSERFFEVFAEEYGGIVYPKLFVGPDRVKETEKGTLYGMDFCTHDSLIEYEDDQMPGSSYWVDDALFDSLLLAIAAQVKRAGFKVLVAHGHGPSDFAFMRLKPQFEAMGLVTVNLVDTPFSYEMKFQNDHACANETSITWAFYPELVHMEYLEDEAPRAMAGRDPRVYASIEYGNEIIDLNKKWLKEKLDEIRKEL